MDLQEITLYDKMLPSTMHLRTLKFLCPTVQEKMHLQENTLFDLDLKVT